MPATTKSRRPRQNNRPGVVDAGHLFRLAALCADVPDWRWEFVTSLRSTDAALLDTSGLDDRWALAAIRFVCSTGMVASDQFDGVSDSDVDAVRSARELSTIDGPIHWAARAFVMSNMSLAEIAQRCSMSTAAAEAFEHLFFDVRPSSGSHRRFELRVEYPIITDLRDLTPELVWRWVALCANQGAVRSLVDDYEAGCGSRVGKASEPSGFNTLLFRRARLWAATRNIDLGDKERKKFQGFVDILRRQRSRWLASALPGSHRCPR